MAKQALYVLCFWLTTDKCMLGVATELTYGRTENQLRPSEASLRITRGPQSYFEILWLSAYGYF